MYKISPMTENDTSKAINLWNINYSNYYNNENFPAFLPEGNKKRCNFLNYNVLICVFCCAFAFKFYMLSPKS